MGLEVAICVGILIRSSGGRQSIVMMVILDSENLIRVNEVRGSL
jgi:hypothetical protein